MLRVPDTASRVIKTPQGIRFDCSGCGNCCLNWPVPLTDRDVSVIRQIDSSLPVRRLPGTGPAKMQAFSHSLEKRQDGRCTYLTSENRCDLHARFGEASKPSMCRLFPYTFSITPTGVCASVSFASTAVLMNTGKLLSEQQEMLQERYGIFQQLFPDLKVDWRTAQLVDGIGFRENRLLALASDFDRILDVAPGDQPPGNVLGRIHRMSERAMLDLPSASDAERMPALESSNEIVDQVLLKYLDKLYFPADVFAEDKFDLDIQSLMRELVSAPRAVSLGEGETAVPFSELLCLKLGEMEEPFQQLVDRFLYCRIFSWLYFGPGFHHLSLLAGLHHLLHLDVLIKLQLKKLILKVGAENVDFFEFAEIVRTLERRLTQVQLSQNAKAGLDVLLPSRLRAERVGSLVE